MKILDASQTATKLIKVLDKGNNKYWQKKLELGTERYTEIFLNSYAKF